MNPTTTITTIEVPSGPGVTWPITQRRNPWAGVAVARISPDSTTEHQVLCELLEGLDKNPSVTGWKKSVEAERDALIAWLAAHPITHIVVLDAQHLNAEGLEIVAGSAALVNARVWLCEEEPVDTYLAARDRWPTTPGTIDELLAALPQPELGDTIEPFPDVVTDGPLTFLAACRDRLDADVYPTVAARFARARTSATEWAQSRELDEDTVIAWLRDKVNDCRQIPEMLTVIRATQVALLDLDGDRWWLQVDLPQFLATADRAPEATVADPATWRDLAAYRDPDRGATCALIAAGAGTDDLSALAVEQIADDGTGATLGDGTTLEVHPTARVYLRAQLWHRRLDGAEPGHLAFVDDGKALHWRRFVRYVRDPALDLGRALTTRAVTKTRPNAGRWASRYGVSVAKL